MGQYFVLVNFDKHEYIDSFNLGYLSKLLEWCNLPKAGIVYFLLRKSTGRGKGDISKDYKYAGRWACDRIALVGDYDESGIYTKIRTKEYEDISRKVQEEYNDFLRS